MRNRHLSVLLVSGLLFILILTGCTLPAAFSPPESPAPLVAEERQPAPPSTSESGGRLLLTSAGDLELLDPSARHSLLKLEGPTAERVGVFYPSPAGGRFAVVDKETGKLFVFEISTGKPVQSIPLLSNPGLDEGRKSVLLTALTADLPPAAVWSPDGTRLAFLAAIDHPFLELYLFDTAGARVTLLSESSADVYQPAWSPDGLWIVFDETEGLNPVGLWAVTSVRAVRANGAETRTLYEPQSYAEPIVGWTSGSSFLVHSVRERGPLELREVSLVNGQSSMIYPGPFDHPVYLPGGNLAIFLVSGEFNDPSVQQAGVYAASADRPPRLLAEGIWKDLALASSAGLVAARDDTRAVLIDPAAGKTAEFAGESCLPAISPDGKTAVFSSGADAVNPGLRLYPAAGGETLLDDPAADSALWLPDGRLVFTAGGSLYLLSSPGEKAVKLADRVNLIGWIGSGADK